MYIYIYIYIQMPAATPPPCLGYDIGPWARAPGPGAQPAG